MFVYVVALGAVKGKENSAEVALFVYSQLHLFIYLFIYLLLEGCGKLYF